MTENLPDTNVGNIEYIRREDAVGAVEFGITLASAINIETGERTELFQKENDELREAVERIKDIEPADVAPVVFCKDCRKRRKDGYCTKFVQNISGLASAWYMPQDDDFCSYGERREE